MGSDPQHVAYPGAEGSYTEEAASRLYPSARQSSYTTFDHVAEALVAGEVIAACCRSRTRSPASCPTRSRSSSRAPSRSSPRSRCTSRTASSARRRDARERARRALAPDGAGAVPGRAERPLRARRRLDDVRGRAHGRCARRRLGCGHRESARGPDVSASRSWPRRSPTTPRTSRASSRWRASRGSTTTPTATGTRPSG